MSVYAMERVRQLLDYVLNRTAAPLIGQCHEIEDVERWFEDEASLVQYRRGLAYMVFRQIVNNDQLAIDAEGNIKRAEWEALEQRLQTMLASGEVPQLDFPQGDSGVWGYIQSFLLEQYRYGDNVTVREGDVFLDCGAYCGDTAVWAIRQGAGRVYSFEPHPAHLDCLRRNDQKYGQGRIVTLPIGLGATEGSMNLEGYGPAARLVAEGQVQNQGQPPIQVPVVTLDNWCRNNAVKPDFIKMDLEGAEVDVLQGARGIITEYKPRLAICLYHRLSDMWVIPRMIKEMVPGYRFWCRQNSLIADFVLYATIEAQA
ncbi:MAG: FkbM family methyltransferase [Azoarcus sp.]|jgi:FkbM family methyltransferase|nr:FkbM family methyltransferase [Azoarcus sp.]